MGEDTGLIVDKFQKQKQKEYEAILELCHLHGVQFSKNMLERGKIGGIDTWILHRRLSLTLVSFIGDRYSACNA